MKKVSLLLTAVLLSAAVAFAGEDGKKDKKSDKKEACSKGEKSCCASKKSAKAEGESSDIKAAVGKDGLLKARAVEGAKIETIKSDKKLVLSEN